MIWNTVSAKKKYCLITSSLVTSAKRTPIFCKSTKEPSQKHLHTNTLNTCCSLTCNFQSFASRVTGTRFIYTFTIICSNSIKLMKVLNVFEVNNKNTRTTSPTSFQHFGYWLRVQSTLQFFVNVFYTSLQSQKQPHKVFYKKSVPINFGKVTRRHLCQSLFFNNVADLRPTTFLKIKTLAQVFFCEVLEIFKNTFF